jgi:membrane protease subunit HflK
MPWSNQGGGGPWGSGGGSSGGGGPSPWGRGTGGGGGTQPPKLEDLIRRGQDRFKRVFPGGGGGNSGPLILLGIGALVLVLAWLCTYRVLPDEQGVVLRFGEWVRTSTPGLNFKLPDPIETVAKPKVTSVNRVDVGFRMIGGANAPQSSRSVPEEALMLTGDENIVDINFNVFWVIKDAGKYLFNIRAPEETVKAAAESAMREVIGSSPIQPILAEGRRKIEQDAQKLLQRILDEYGAGVDITQLQLQKVDPPTQVVDAFRDVQRARADLERQRNEAEAYRNDIIPRARGDAERVIQEAEGYKQQVVAQAEGDANRFLAVYRQFVQAKDVTQERIYLETMEDILKRTNKIIIDQAAQGQGVVPYLPLPEIQKRQPAQAKQPAQTNQPQATTGAGR